MRVLISITASLLATAVTATPITKRSVDFNYNSKTIYGVNIGGWLVLEPWITPSIFQQANGPNPSSPPTIVDEWTLCEHDPNAASILTTHWDNWVQESDFAKIADIGFNMVRIPVGYWAFQNFPGDTYIKANQVDYLDKAIGWASNHGLKVWIDLHGAPGSQNGYDNSGHNGTAGWSTPDTTSATRSVIQQIANRYAKNQATVIGIELLNEPLLSKLPGGSDALYQYYKDGFGDVRVVSDTPVVIHDAFQSASALNGVLPASSGDQNVIVDHHEYQCFTDAMVLEPQDTHISSVCPKSGSYANNADHWVIVGEWSGAMTDCASALNGYGVGSRYEGNYYLDTQSTGRSCGNINFINEWDSTMKRKMGQYINVQLDTYSQRTRGSIFWNFKTENSLSPEWDAFALYDHGIFPSLKNRQSTSLCSG